jgi:hypothetical protein
MHALLGSIPTVPMANYVIRILHVVSVTHSIVDQAGWMLQRAVLNLAQVDLQVIVLKTSYVSRLRLAMKFNPSSVGRLLMMLTTNVAFHAHPVEVVIAMMAKVASPTHYVVNMGRMRYLHHPFHQFQAPHQSRSSVVPRLMMLLWFVMYHAQVANQKIAPMVNSALLAHLAVIEVPSSVEQRGRKLLRLAQCHALVA